MKKSDRPRAAWGIRPRMMLYLTGFVVFLILLLWLFQVVWLDEFYRWDKQRQTKMTAELLCQHTADGELDTLIDYLAERSSCCILVVDERGRILHESPDDKACLIHRLPSRELNRWCSRVPDEGMLTELLMMPGPEAPSQTPPFVHDWFPPPFRQDRESLLGIRRVMLADGAPGYLLINTIITPLDSTVQTLRLQLMLVTAVLLVAAVALAFIISRRVTRPIIRVNLAARELSYGRYDPPAEGRSYREIDELNATLAKAADELSQVEHLQHELIANISHDLRTPLTMIGGYAEVMRDIPGEATVENYQIIIDETNRLTSLVSELLDFSRLQTGNAAMEMVDFDLTDAVSTIVQRVSAMTSADGYRVVFAPESSVVTHADEKRIGQVVYNLLGNALTYTGEDKTVTITQTEANGTVRIAVRDTGKGIAPEELTRIWHRYYRAKESHRRAVIGSGLGLSIVEGILEKHGAKYGVDSLRAEADPVNHGTTFWFELPVVTLPEEIAGE